MRAITVMLVIIIVAGPAYSQQHSALGFAGVGGRSCAEFSGDYGEDPTTFGALYFFWAQGMMSGLNAQIPFKPNQKMTNLALWNIERQKQHIRLFCFRNPLASYVVAVLDLFDSMRREEGLPDWRW